MYSWPEGTPVICGENQSEIHLSNGDIGIVVGEGDKKRLLFRFNSNDQGQVINLIHPARVRKLDPAFAITIHKAQGSESNNVICLWPDKLHKDSKAILSIQGKQEDQDYQRKLLYTAITRAKKRFDLTITAEEQLQKTNFTR